MSGTGACNSRALSSSLPRSHFEDLMLSLIRQGFYGQARSGILIFLLDIREQLNFIKFYLASAGIIAESRNRAGASGLAGSASGRSHQIADFFGETGCNRNDAVVYVIGLHRNKRRVAGRK